MLIIIMLYKESIIRGGYPITKYNYAPNLLELPKDYQGR